MTLPRWMQALPPCLVTDGLLPAMLVKTWARRGTRACRQGSYLSFALVTVCFKEVLSDVASGGVEGDGWRGATACVWLSSILTAMVHVRGVSLDPFLYPLQQNLSIATGRCQ